MESKSVKEGRNVQEIEAKHRVKSALCVKVKLHTENMTWKTTQMQLTKLFCLQLHTRLLAMQPNTLSLQFWNKADNKKGITKNSWALFCMFTMTGDHNKAHTTSKDCWWDYIHISPQKEQQSFVLDLYPCGWSRLGVTPREKQSTRRTNSNTFRRVKRSGRNETRAFYERTLLMLLMMNSLKKKKKKKTRQQQLKQ